MAFANFSTDKVQVRHAVEDHLGRAFDNYPARWKTLAQKPIGSAR